MTRSFTYVPNFADNFHGVVLALWGHRAARMRSGLTCLMFGLFASLILWLAGMPPRSVAPAAGLLAVAWGLFVTFAIGGYQTVLLTRRQRAIGPAEIRVSDEGLRRATRAGSLDLEWDAVARVEETGRVFLLHGATKPVFAIEKSAVRSPAELAGLREFIRARVPGSPGKT